MVYELRFLLNNDFSNLNGSLEENLKKITLIPRKWAGVNVLAEIFEINGEAGGVIFYPHMYLKEIHFSANGIADSNGVVAQVGFCTSDASVPEVYTTGEKRITYVNYIGGEHIFNINGMIDYFFIAGPNGLSISNLVGILY